MKTKITVLLLVLCLFSSCTTLQTISFERLQAADISFPEQVRTVGVINYVPQDNMGADSLLGLWNGDGTVAVEALAQEIAATNYFEQVLVCDSAFRGDTNVGEEAIPSYQTDSLIRLLGVDMLFAIERVQVELKNGSIFFPEMMANLLVVDGIVTPVVRAYIAGRDIPLFSFSKSDTIYWELSSELTYEQMIKEASEYAAQLPVKYLLPHWKEVSRYYFDGGNAEMRDAGVYVREQDWEAASVLWQKLHDTRKGKTKMRAAYNLALYYELLEDFERAKEYLDIASSLAQEGTWENQLIEYYRLQLEEQGQENRMLKIQMKRFEP
ncbi:MAG: hypothetical protein IJE78_14185 [Bacteroidaceae bacterium]|nr:hypothetical protein [Bacteroidaceae bacterium]